MRRVLACLTFLVVSISIFGANSFAQDYNFSEAGDGQAAEALLKIVPVRFLPSSPLHSLIFMKEVFSRAFKPSAARRAEFDFVLSGKRLKEAYLLLQGGDIKNAGETLDAYSKRSRKVAEQLAKARSQNQDVTKLVGTIADELRTHEILLHAIYKNKTYEENSYHFQSSFNKAYEGFVEIIEAVDELRPGVKDRFSMTKRESPTPEPSASPVLLEATPSFQPRRIIY